MKASPEQTLEDSPTRAPVRQLAGNRREQPTDDATAEAVERLDSERYDSRRWGLSATAVTALAERLYECWQRFRTCCKPRTRAPSEQAYDSLRGPLPRDRKRHVANLVRTTTGDDGQALQHGMSHSPWSGPGVFRQMQAESTATPALGQGGTLMLDESADEQAGPHNAGAARPYHGRRGQVDRCRVDTCLTSANPTVGLWTIVEGELCLPAEWCGEERAERRQARGIPPDRTCETTRELGLQRINRVTAHGVVCERVAGDACDGRDSHGRAAWDAADVPDAAQVPADTRVYLREPRVGVPTQRRQRGRPRPRLRILSRQQPHEVRALARRPQTTWSHVQVRHTERGRREADCAVPWVWTGAEGQQPRAAGLVIRWSSGLARPVAG